MPGFYVLKPRPGRETQHFQPKPRNAAVSPWWQPSDAWEKKRKCPLGNREQSLQHARDGVSDLCHFLSTIIRKGKLCFLNRVNVQPISADCSL